VWVSCGATCRSSMRSPEVDSPESGSKARLAKWGEVLGLAALSGLIAFFLATSWRKWPEPLIDFGRELYLPWRLSNGALLYRDADDFYGPLSQYLNAGLFRLVGPGLMKLAAANLVIFAAILTSIYVLFRRAWGIAAALASCAVFVSVFGFSVVNGGNYNYVTPYAHEATHGFLVCLLLVFALARWLDRPTVPNAGGAGFLFGLTAVLKPEIMLSAGLVTGAALMLGRMRSKPLRVSQAVAWVAAAALPTIAFWAYFSTQVPFTEALMFASRAWISVVATTQFTGEFIQASFLGFDHPWANLLKHAFASIVAAVLIGGLVAAAKFVERGPRLSIRILVGSLSLGGIAWIALEGVDWFLAGRCLLGLVLFYLSCSFISTARYSNAGVDASRYALRWMIAVLAAAMMSRMLLNARIIQFGFYQAALAGILVPAVLIGELPGRIGLGRWGRATLVALTVTLIGIGATHIAIQSQNNLLKKTYEVGEGADRFYTYPPQIDATGELVNVVSEELREMPGKRSLVVMPEGEMINYLARMPSPIAPFFFFSEVTRGNREQAVVDDLQKHPPDWIVVISRNLRDHGIERYAQRPGEGQQILEWASSNYNMIHSVGEDPLDPDMRGAVILHRP
jgi:hypothetical protein